MSKNMNVSVLYSIRWSLTPCPPVSVCMTVGQEAGGEGWVEVSKGQRVAFGGMGWGPDSCQQA